ncbi:MAG: Holliday junction branch migration protein RuvA [Proteobacteria bacterium]|nr:Holliday junction branch migration protein RuvA [Pseudomonadota bacterium]MBU1714620.1 Holliday junction branch migration protein RuvA [Pseudomonadota bacterium]
MIACLRGELFAKFADRLIIDVGGVGYEVFLSSANFALLPTIGAELFLHIYTNVREDALDLYGFIEAEEKQMFLLLVGVSGVGPKLALNILSGSRPSELAGAICAGDIGRLVKLPGVGKKTAERLCLELKDKVEFMVRDMSGGQIVDRTLPADQLSVDAVSALVNLGYTPNAARNALELVRKQVGAEIYPAMKIEELLRQALRSLA